MGGYDLYGTYYENRQDALNAELSQMNEIDNRANERRLDEQAREIQRLKRQIKQQSPETA